MKRIIISAVVMVTAVGLVSSKIVKAGNTPPPAPQTVLVWATWYQGDYTVRMFATSSSPGAPTVGIGDDLATVDATLRGEGFHVTHISDNQLYRSYEK